MEVSEWEGQGWRQESAWRVAEASGGGVGEGCVGGGCGHETHWAVRGRQGDCVMHCGQIPHGGAAVTSGMTTTEPRESGYANFSTSWKLYFGGRSSGGAKKAAALDRRARQPLQSSVVR